MSLAERDRPPDELIAGKYRLTRLLGRGGMGSVWEGIHTSLGTRVAVKFIETEYATSSEARNRFENEARAAAKLRSKHVVQVYDHGLTADGRPFIVMEFLAGEPLDKRLDRVGRLSPVDTARILQQVCRALGRAHEAGIVHRDLKPENVFLVWDEEDGADIVKVVDFGIAKFTDGSMGVSSATRTGSVLGTPYYMSPEQARGLRSVDHRSDLWSVGVIAYRCVVGELPFYGEAIGDLLVKICTAPLPVPSQRAPGVPPSFDAWFAKALDREPSQRFASAAAASDALSAAFGLAVRAPVPSASGTQRSAMNAVTPGLATPMRQGAYTPPTAHMYPYDSGVVQPTAAMGTPTPGRASNFDANSGTGAPFTATPTLSKRPSRAPLFAAIAIACLLLGVGIAVAAKLLRHGSPSEQPSAEQAPSASAAPIEVAAAGGPAASASAEKPDIAPDVSAKAASKESVAPAASAKEESHASVTGTRSGSSRPNPRLPAPPRPDSRPHNSTKPNAGAIDVGY